MKKLKYKQLLFTFFLLGMGTAAQSQSPLSIDLNIVRYSTTAGLSPAYHYIKWWSYINGFGINYRADEKYNYSLGIQKIKGTPRQYFGTVAEKTNISGASFYLAWEYLSDRKKRFHLGYSLQLFGEFTHHVGEYLQDVPPHRNEVNLRKSYYGLAPQLAFYLRLSPQIKLMLATRFQWGRVHFKALDNDGSIGFTRYRNSWREVFDPLNTLALRFDLGRY